MLTFRLESGASLTLRASGTEPKLKYYLDVPAVDRKGAVELADAVEAAVARELVRPEAYGLKNRPAV